MAENSYDVRAVRLIKMMPGAAEEKVGKEQTEKPSYICMGHFDEMQVDKLGEGGFSADPLKLLEEDRVSRREGELAYAENCVCSLYILKQMDQAPGEPNSHADEKEEVFSDIKSFWGDSGYEEEETPETFIVVTRIHCDFQKEEERGKTFSRIISEKCQSQTQENARVVYKKIDERERVLGFSCAVEPEGKEKAEVRCVLYDSLELGDTVAVMKSLSLSAALELIRYFSTIKNVCDTYTYCGINREILRAGRIVQDRTYHSKAVIPHVAMRFFVGSNGKAQEFMGELEAVKETSGKFFVTGTADHLFQWKDCKEADFLRIMGISERLMSDRKGSFEDVITRVGLRQENLQEKEKKDGKILDRVKKLEDVQKWLREECGEENAENWKYFLLKQLGSLEAMNRNYVMDDLAELLIPGVDAFLERLDYIRGQNELDMYEEDIKSFLSCWTGLTNDISQLESQMTQHPELNPVRYYIPAMLLRFVLCFVELCDEVLKGKNQDSQRAKRSFRPMLVPADVHELAVLCPLDPQSETYEGACPLIIYIPIRELYRPWETIHRVVHERGHFGEASSRGREKRHKVLTECLASYMTEMWELYYFGKPENGEVKSGCGSYKEIMKENLETLMEAACPEEREWYLSVSGEELEKAAYKIVADGKYEENFLLHVYPSYFCDDSCVYQRTWNETQRGSAVMLQGSWIATHIEGLQMLCSEGYADIVMILLLGCSFEDYYVCIYRNEHRRLREEENRRTGAVDEMRPAEGVDQAPLAEGPIGHIQRMALVIQAVSGLKGKKPAGWERDKIKDFGQKKAVDDPWILLALQFIDDPDSFPPAVRFGNKLGELPGIPRPEEQKLLKNYLKGCAEEFEEELNGSDKEKIRKNITCVKPDTFDWEKLRQFVSEMTLRK